MAPAATVPITRAQSAVMRREFRRICSAPREPYPRFQETRRFGTDGASYFGPYTSSRSLRQTLGALQKIYPLRTCSDGVFKSYERRGRPCLEHAVGRCAAPCCKLIDDDAYAELVAGAIRLLKGRAGTGVVVKVTCQGLRHFTGKSAVRLHAHHGLIGETKHADGVFQLRCHLGNRDHGLSRRYRDRSAST